LIQIICSVCLTEIVLGEESEERKFEKNYPRTIQIFLSSAKFSSAAFRKIWLRFGKFGLYSDNFFQIFFLRSLRPYNFLQNCFIIFHKWPGVTFLGFKEWKWGALFEAVIILKCFYHKQISLKIFWAITHPKGVKIRCNFLKLRL